MKLDFAEVNEIAQVKQILDFFSSGTKQIIMKSETLEK